MIRTYQTNKLIRWYYPSCIWTKPSNDSIYLTFDDGPTPETTPWLLSELRKVGAKATFFCLGKQVRENEVLMRSILADGHQIANHSYSHMNGHKVSDGEYLTDIQKCDEALNDLQIETTYFRPPYGRIRKSQLKLIPNKKVVMWSHLSWDFDPGVNIGKSVQKMKSAKPGSILTFHDSQKAFANLKSMLPGLLDHYLENGLHFKRIDQ